MKNFFAALFGTLLGLILMIFLGLGVISSLADVEPDIPESAFLVINIGGGLPEYTNTSEIQSALSGDPVSVYGIFESLYKAAEDERIKGILFQGAISSVSIATVQEIMGAVKRFKEKSGKPVYFFSEYLLNGGLLFSTVCDTTFIIPEAVVGLKGISIVSTHYQEGMEKIGVEADFIAIGKYKNYPEMFTRNDLSESSKEVYNHILDYFWNEYLTRLSDKTGRTPQEIEDGISGGVFDAKTALEMGFVDKLIYRDELMDHLGEENDLVYYAAYSQVSRKSLGLYKGSTIALIYASGSITTGYDSDDPILGSSMGSSRVAGDIRMAASDESVKAIVFRISSPGGMVNASDVIWRELNEARSEKPVIISVGPICASGGYYVALAGDSIIANPGSIMGSIGVFMGKFVAKELSEDILGIHSDRLDRGAHAAIFSTDAKFTRIERRLLTGTLTDFYSRFVNKVADARNKSYAEIDRVAQGRVWIGEANLANGLVDSFGDLDDAFAAAIHKAGLDPEKGYKWKLFPKKMDFLTELQSRTYILEKTPIDYLKTSLEVWLGQPQMLALYPFQIKMR